MIDIKAVKQFTVQIQMNKQNKVVEVQIGISNPYLQYLSKFSELRHPLPTQLQQLSDGVILTELFLMLKNFQIIEELNEQPKTFSHKFSNLKMLLRSIQKYWNDQLLLELESEDIDIVEIGHYGTPSEIEKILQLFVKTAARSETKQPFIQKILMTSEQTQQFLKKVIEKTINPTLDSSPVTKKRNRMIDRLLELDHQNQKLQQLIEVVCNQKYDLQMKNKSLNEALNEKSLQIEEMRSQMGDLICTPKKQKRYGVGDTSDRKDNHIEYLKNQMKQMSSQHEKQIQEYQMEIERLNYRVQYHEKIKEQLQLSQSIIKSHKQILEEAQEMQNKISNYKAEIMNKDNIISVMRSKLQKYEITALEMERNELNLKAEIERKSITISEMSFKMEKLSPKKGNTHNNLYLQFPEIINTEANAYIQTNRALRQQLERSRIALEKRQIQLQKANDQLDSLRKCESQNKKLRELIIQQKSYKGEEIEILVNALHHLRKRVKQNISQQRALREKNV